MSAKRYALPPMFTWKRIAPGQYETRIAGHIPIDLLHTPENGPGFEWTAESPDEGVPNFYGSTKAQVTRMIERHFGVPQ